MRGGDKKRLGEYVGSFLFAIFSCYFFLQLCCCIVSYLFIFIFFAKGKILYDGYLFQIRMFYQLQNNKEIFIPVQG